MLDIILFLLGLAFLLIGSKGVIDNSLVFAKKTSVSPLIIGIILVGIGTSLPEIFVSIFSGLDGAIDLGLGNVIGSNTAHICLFFGALIFFRSMHIGRIKTQKNALLMLILTIIFSFLLVVNRFSFFSGLIFIIFGCLLIYWQITQGRKGAVNEDRKEMDKLSGLKLKYSLPAVIFLFVLSLAALIIGGKLVVDAGIKIALMLNVSSFIIGITAVAIGTSLPELAVTIRGAIAREDKLVIGNILGSNIYNILFCGGILGLFNAGGINNILTISVFLISNLFFVFLIFIYKGNRIPKYFGIIFLLLYIIYIRFLFV